MNFDHTRRPFCKVIYGLPKLLDCQLVHGVEHHVRQARTDRVQSHRNYLGVAWLGCWRTFTDPISL